MRQIINFTLFSLLIILFLNGCQLNNETTNEDIFQYKGSYVGDNSAVGNLAYQLPNGEFLDSFELKTTEEPYGIILNYKSIEAEDLLKTYKETAVYNATFIFALVQNADWITFNFGEKAYKITRENLQNWYGKELSEFTSEDAIRELIQEYLQDDHKVNQLFG
ncbi:MAG: DUF4825 domain-containing protein [Bacillaceae bacterium]|nr:DUF4825 domain-containing protein [Bacillaceae bacterium]